MGATYREAPSAGATQKHPAERRPRSPLWLHQVHTPAWLGTLCERPTAACGVSQTTNTDAMGLPSSRVRGSEWGLPRGGGRLLTLGLSLMKAP